MSGTADGTIARDPAYAPARQTYPDSMGGDTCFRWL